MEQQLPLNKKYAAKNALARRLVRQFFSCLTSLTAQADHPPITILDIGCAEGAPLHHLLTLFPQATITGLDLEAGLLQAARHNAPGAALTQGDIYDLPFPDRSFDLVICTEVLEHLEHPEAALQEVERVGAHRYVLSVPNEPYWRLANMVRGSYWRSLGNTPGHLNHWSSRGFVRFVQSRLTVTQVRRPFPWTMLAATRTTS